MLGSDWRDGWQRPCVSCKGAGRLLIFIALRVFWCDCGDASSVVMRGRTNHVSDHQGVLEEVPRPLVADAQGQELARDQAALVRA